jgi:hypothetical protein
MIDFKAMKARSKNDFKILSEKVEKLSENKFQKDQRFWELTVDKAGNGYAIIRFLPTLENEEVPFVFYWDHGFKGPTGQWYIELSRTTLKDESGNSQPDPVSEYNTMRWNEKDDDDAPGRKFVRGTPGNPGAKRRLHYISNIYVVEDPANPANNGKVFLFRYGKKIYNLLDGAMHPKLPTRKAFNPFNFWDGANFVLAAIKKDGYRNYDSESRFDTCGPLADDETMEKIYGSQYPLLPFVAPEKFKSYEELQRKFNRVMSLNVSGPSTLEEAPMVPQQQPKAAPVLPVEDDTPPWESNDESDPDLAVFQKMATD